jgi:hypothetical protein
MRQNIPIIVISILAFGSLSAWAQENNTCQASLFMWDAYANRPIVGSPDASKHVQLWSSARDPEPEQAKFYASIYSGSRRLKTIEIKELSAATFVKWAPDSKAFYVMWSDGGAIGGYHVRVFLVNDEQATESPAPKNVAADFAQHHSCKTRGNNLYAIRWERGSEQLLLEPEVYPTSDCGKSAGFALGYLVDIETGEINQRYTADQMKPLVTGCPSTVFPTAFATQEGVDKSLKDSNVKK